jgi:tetratricopeptide (TPR) repeat protein
MAVDKNKIIAEATKLVQKGAYDKAIAAYQKILAQDPKDVRVLLKVGELQQKKGDASSAAQSFERVAETYAEQGFFLKAVAVYKQIAKLDPDDVAVNERLAGLYQQLGLVSDAMSQYQVMAGAHEKAGDGAKLTDVLKRMVELDPDNIASSIKLGELYARAHQVGPALECLRRAADYLKRQNRADEYLKVAERIAALEPEDVGLTRELANIYLAKGDTKRALAKLQLCFKADPKDAETLQLLAQAFRDLGQTSKTVSVYKELARVHEERGSAQEARSAWRKVQELVPGDDDAAAAMGGAAAASPAATSGNGARPPPAGPGPPPLARAPHPGPPPGVPRVVGREPAILAAPPAAPDATAKLLVETDVYVKYGLFDKALDHLRRVLAVDPQCGDTHEKACEIHLAAGRPEDAAGAAALAVRAFLAKDQLERARAAMSRLRQIAPDRSELAELAEAFGAIDEVEFVELLDEEVVLSPDDGEEEPQHDEDAIALAAAGAEEEEVVEDEDASAARPPPAPAVSPRTADSAARLAPAPPRPLAVPPGPAPDADEEEVDLSDELEEADFFVQQGLLEDAREALRNLIAFYPDHRAVKEKLAELERRTAPAARADRGIGPRDPAREAAGDAGFDIARELAELGGGAGASAADDEFQYSVEDVFKQFKKGVEQTVKPEDSATHYDLGIAYKEMGLLDDAIHEFEVSLRGSDRARKVDCLSMVGLCRMAKGDGRGAVAAFRRALASDHVTKDAARAILFDLAAAYEAASDREAALHYFQRVVKLDPSFRNAAARAAALGGGPGRPPPEDRAARAPPSNGAPPPAVAAPPRAPVPPPAPPKKNIGYL